MNSKESLAKRDETGPIYLLPDEIGGQTIDNWHYGLIAKKIEEIDETWGPYGKSYIYSKSTGKDGGLTDCSNYYADFNVGTWIKFRNESTGKFFEGAKQQYFLCETKIVQIAGKDDTTYLAKVKTEFFIVPPKLFHYATAFVDGKTLTKVWSPVIGAAYIDEECLLALQICPGEMYEGWLEFIEPMNFAPFVTKSDGSKIDRNVYWKVMLKANLDDPIQKRPFEKYSSELKTLCALGRSNIIIEEAQDITKILTPKIVAREVIPEKTMIKIPSSSKIVPTNRDRSRRKKGWYYNYLRENDLFPKPINDLKTAYKQFFSSKGKRSKRLLKIVLQLQEERLKNRMADNAKEDKISCNNDSPIKQFPSKPFGKNNYVDKDHNKNQISAKTSSSEVYIDSIPYNAKSSIEYNRESCNTEPASNIYNNYLIETSSNQTQYSLDFSNITSVSFECTAKKGVPTKKTTYFEISSSRYDESVEKDLENLSLDE